MELILKRIAKRKTYTIGHLWILPDSLLDREGSGKNSENEAFQKTNVSAPLPTREGQGSGSAGESLEGPFCDTLEPTWRDYEHGQRKIPGRSAIPEGRYAVVISWSPKFKQWLPVLLGGPEFNKRWQGIRIHAGNTCHDTEGCILVGENRRVGEVLDSRLWLHRLKQKIVEAKDRGEAVHLTVM
ncbi:MAG: hypothetical protein IJ197_03760 [Bacteroidaceae bacterium]|nr:hypothetical protein [Bacteroidaceae bacterium]